MSNFAQPMKSTTARLIALLAIAGFISRPATTAYATPASDSSERHFEMLKVGELAFTNVWVHRQTNFNILIRHSGGIHTIKLTDLPAGELTELKSQIGDLAAVEKSSDKPAASGLLDKLKSALKGANPQTLAIIGAAVLLLIGLVIVARRSGRSATTN